MTPSILIEKQEGRRLKVYTDTEGHPTIGIGRALDTRGISDAEADFMLENDVRECTDDLVKLLRDAFALATTARRSALVSMRFQLGATGFRGFEDMITAIEIGDWFGASQHALDSKWATQTPDRAKEIAEMLRTGNWPAWALGKQA